MSRLRKWVRRTTVRFGRLRSNVAHYLLLPDLVGPAGRELRTQVIDTGALTSGYMLMCGLSAGIATLGLLQSSTAVVIGAMLVSPLMGPIVALGFAFSSLDGHRVRDAARVVAIGAIIGIGTAMLLTWLSPIRNATPEIVARTAPTLLDLGVALLSGLAGGYAVVKRLGATAVGVAIATALMPPLATIGYGLATLRWAFAGGAFLLFLTNLGAIAFAVASVARLSGAARPLANVEKSPMYMLAGLGSFLILAVPLGLTLLQVTHEATALSAARSVLAKELSISPNSIAQLDVSWPLRATPTVDAVVIAPSFREDAQAVVLKRLTEQLGTEPELNLQQVVAADIGAQTRAMIDAAMERTAAGISNDVPPFAEIRAALAIPVQSLWTNRAERIVNIVPIAAPGWLLGDYREAEGRLEAIAGGWQVKVVPPVQAKIPISAAPEARVADIRLASWAIERWGLRSTRIDMFTGRRSPEAVAADGELIVKQFRSSGISASIKARERAEEGAEVTVFGPSPSQERAAQANGSADGKLAN